MICAGDKTKLLIIGTRQMRHSKLTQNGSNVQIDVFNNLVEDTKSEKLLGLIVNNELTWKEQLYGESWRPKGENSKGLIPQLSKRVGILRKLSKYLPMSRFKSISSGLFDSKLIYCLPVFGNVWISCTNDDKDRKSPGFSKEDNRKLQVLQNKVCRLKLGQSSYDISTQDLLKECDQLSVHQLTALHTLLMVHKCVTHQKPKTLANKLTLSHRSNRRKNQIANVNYMLSISRAGFCYRGATLWNLLPNHLRKPGNDAAFKKGAKSWVLNNIPIKPT